MSVVISVFRLRGRGGPQEVLWFPDPAPRPAEGLTLGGRPTLTEQLPLAEWLTGPLTLAGHLTVTLPPLQRPLM